MKKNTLMRFFNYVKRYKFILVASIFCAVISVAGSLAGPIYMGKAIDAMLGPGKVNFSIVTKTAVILIVVYVVSNMGTWLLTYLTNTLAYRTANSLRHDLIDKLNKLPLKFYDTNPHGDIISRFVNDVDTISDGMLQSVSALLTGVATIIGAIGFMLYISPIMTLVVVLSAPISFFIARFITTRSQNMFKEQAKSIGVMNGYIEEIIGEQKVVKAFNYEKRSFNKFKDINDVVYESGVKSQFYGSLANPSTRLINNLAFSIVGMVGSAAAIFGSITVGDISSFLIYSNLFSKPFSDITGVITQIQAAVASAQRVFYILDLDEEVPDDVDAEVLNDCKGRVSFDDVYFSYVSDRKLIQDFNIDVKPGSKIAIVGKTGAGKTTIVNLLMRFYDIDSGKISIDGTDIKKITRDSLRQNFGMVLQDTWLFEGSMRDNIAYGKPDATDEEVIAAAKAAGAHGFIKRLKNGYDTIITDSGENISQGQKQLLTIARVMLADPPMIILDEATSSIDTRTEIKIQKAFDKITKGRTSFVIAHRLSTIREADLILVMDSGSIVESGTHEELLKKNGCYAKLYNSQFAPI